MNTTNMTSSFSHRETRRRNPVSRRNSRSLSWRRVYRARSYCPGVRRLCLGGTPGPSPQSTASCRVSWPSYARSINRWIGRGMLPKRCASVRPSGASWAGPGDRATGMAVRASAAILWIVVVHPPRDWPMACGPFFLTPPCQLDGPWRWSGPRRRLRSSRGGSAGGATVHICEPTPRASTTDSCAYRGGARCRTAWADRAMCHPARRHTRWRLTHADCRAARCRVASANTARFGDTVRRWFPYTPHLINMAVSVNTP